MESAFQYKNSIYTLGQNGGNITLLSEMVVLAYFHCRKPFA